MSQTNPPEPTHVRGTNKGEELATKKGREPGRGETKGGDRNARDSTSISPKDHEPIDPRMPHVPPA